MNNQSYKEGIIMNLHSQELLYKLSEFYKIFADSTRLRILDALQKKAMCVNEISEVLNMNQSAISHQLKNLRSSNLVKTSKEGKNVIYSLSDSHIEKILDYGLEHISEVLQ